MAPGFSKLLDEKRNAVALTRGTRTKSSRYSLINRPGVNLSLDSEEDTSRPSNAKTHHSTSGLKAAAEENHRQQNTKMESLCEDFAKFAISRRGIDFVDPTGYTKVLSKAISYKVHYLVVGGHTRRLNDQPDRCHLKADYVMETLLRNFI